MEHKDRGQMCTELIKELYRKPEAELDTMFGNGNCAMKLEDGTPVTVTRTKNSPDGTSSISVEVPDGGSDDGHEMLVDPMKLTADNAGCKPLVDPAALTAAHEAPRRRVSEKPHTVDNVNHPAHYTRGGIECIDALASAVVGKKPFEAVCVANVIKYLWRYEEKNGLEDVRKAKWYLDRLESVMAGEGAGRA